MCMVEMFSLEQWLFILGATLLVNYLLHLLRLERKWDVRCFIVGYFVFVAFFSLVIFSLVIDRLDLIPELISSFVIALLTLTFVWAELSKRPELKLGDFAPIIRKKNTTDLAYKAGYHDEPPKPSRFLKIRQASYDNLRFDEHFSFSVDLSNIGYQEIMVHEYVYYINGKRQKPIPLGEPPYDKRLRLITQDRHTIDMLRLRIKSAGFHKIRLVVIATNEKRSKEVWFYISKDFRKLRYVEMNPYKRLLSPLVKNKMKDP